MTDASGPVAAMEAPIRRWRAVLAGLMTVMALAIIDANIVNTSLPRIASDLGGMAEMAWAITAFLLATTVSAPLYGKLSDLYGRRPLMLAAIVIFLVGSMLCGTASSMPALILDRVVQGLGAGGLVTLVQATIGDLVAPAHRARYQTSFTTLFAVSSLVGPLLGRMMTTHLSWRWIFYVNVPIGGVALALLVTSLPRSAVGRRPTIDFIGAALITVATTAFLLAIGSGSPGASTIGLAATAIVGTLLFVVQERRAVEPILDLRLFTDRTFAIAVSTTVVMSFALLAALLLLPLYLQVVDRQTPLAAAMIVMPQMAGIVLSSVVGARLATHVGDVACLLTAGVVLQTLALWAAVAGITVGVPLWTFSLIALMLGAGMGIGMPNAITLVQNAVQHDQLGVATGAIAFFRSLGGAAGVAVSGMVVTTTLRVDLDRAGFGEIGRRRLIEDWMCWPVLIRPGRRSSCTPTGEPSWVTSCCVRWPSPWRWASSCCCRERRDPSPRRRPADLRARLTRQASGKTEGIDARHPARGPIPTDEQILPSIYNAVALAPRALQIRISADYLFSYGLCTSRSRRLKPQVVGDPCAVHH